MNSVHFCPCEGTVYLFKRSIFFISCLISRCTSCFLGAFPVFTWSLSLHLSMPCVYPPLLILFVCVAHMWFCSALVRRCCRSFPRPSLTHMVPLSAAFVFGVTQSSLGLPEIEERGVSQSSAGHSRVMQHFEITLLHPFGNIVSVFSPAVGLSDVKQKRTLSYRLSRILFPLLWQIQLLFTFFFFTFYT